MFLGLPWTNIPFNYNINHNSPKFVYNLNERTVSMINKNYLYLPLSELKNNSTGEIIKLNKSINFQIDINENGFYYINDEYNIYAYGTTQEDAENDVLEEFKKQYEFYAKEDDKNLDENAKLLKKSLLEIYGGKHA